ncbi:hypothetical protein FAUST_6205 [Fusarium austroamericanum]|uniref:Uncharacterized protein n=1 Tax=Fusarium austroamericanum TaxID=282268 RepID=A0AAN6BZQ6_FUSAU|nr:hypothetical protein FAUST_6205 [Fusarium austroamericanum]
MSGEYTAFFYGKSNIEPQEDEPEPMSKPDYDDFHAIVEHDLFNLYRILSNWFIILEIGKRGVEPIRLRDADAYSAFSEPAALKASEEAAAARKAAARKAAARKAATKKKKADKLAIEMEASAAQDDARRATKAAAAKEAATDNQLNDKPGRRGRQSSQSPKVPVTPPPFICPFVDGGPVRQMLR